MKALKSWWVENNVELCMKYNIEPIYNSDKLLNEGIKVLVSRK